MSGPKTNLKRKPPLPKRQGATSQLQDLGAYLRLAEDMRSLGPCLGPIAVEALVLGHEAQGWRLHPLLGAALAAFDRAKHTGYLDWTGKEGQDGRELYPLWWGWCAATHQPFVAFKRRVKAGFLELELLEPGLIFSVTGQAELGCLLRDQPRAKGVGWGDKAFTCAHLPVEIVDETVVHLLGIVGLFTVARSPEGSGPEGPKPRLYLVK